MLEPPLEGLLRSVDLAEEIITAFRVEQERDRELCTALHSTKLWLEETCPEAFDIDLVIGLCPHGK